MKLYANITEKELKEILRTHKELSGLARVKHLGSQGFYLYDFNIISSYNKYGFTSLTIDDLDKFFRGLIKRGVSTNDFLCWWHTHPYGMADFSPYDDNTIDDVLNDSDYFISVVFTHRLEFAGRLRMFKPFNFSADLDVELCDKDLNPRNVKEELAKCKDETRCIENTNATRDVLAFLYNEFGYPLLPDDRRGYERDILTGEDIIRSITDTKVEN